MFISTIADRGATPALVKTLAYNEARLRMIAENVANIHTPGYRSKQLDVRGFQSSLRQALDARGSDAGKPLKIDVGREVSTGRDGYLKVEPGEKPVDNVLHHDGTSLSIEREMADLAETGMAHNLSMALLRERFDGLRKAIRGTI
jgi:flagellar basal-body rod protein FlgB